MSTIVEYIVKLNDQFSPGLKKMKAGLKGVSASVNKMNSELGNLGVAIAGLAIIGLSRKLIKLGSDFEETNSKFATVFQNVSTESETVAKNLEKNFGLSSLASKTLLSDTGDLLTGFGFTGKMALNLSEEVQTLAVDLASFTNFAGGATGASQALTKALLGERESVKSLGISILDSDVKARVKQMVAMGKLRGMTIRQQKAFATLKIAQEQSKNAIGDYARTSKGFANTMRRVGALAENFGVALGQTLVEMIHPLVNILEKLGRFVNKNKEFFQDFLTILIPFVAAVGLIIIAVKGWVVVQKILNLTLWSNPISLIILAIAALIGIIVVAYRRSETFRRVLDGLWNVMKWGYTFLKTKLTPIFGEMDVSIKSLGQSILDNLINRFKIFLKGISGVGRALKLLFEGEFKRAAQVGGKAAFNLTAGLVLGKDAEDMMNIGRKVGKVFKHGFDKETGEVSKLGGVSDLAGSLTSASPASDQLSSKVKGSSATVTGAAPKIFNLNIEKLIETLEIKAESVKESTNEIKDVVLQALTSALADVQTIVR